MNGYNKKSTLLLIYSLQIEKIDRVKHCSLHDHSRVKKTTIILSESQLCKMKRFHFRHFKKRWSHPFIKGVFVTLTFFVLFSILASILILFVIHLAKKSH